MLMTDGCWQHVRTAASCSIANWSAVSVPTPDTRTALIHREEYRDGKTHKTTVRSQATLDHTTEHSDVDVTAAQRNSHALALEFWDVKRATLSQPGMR